MSKLWQKTTNVNKLVENFTVGRDRELDRQMAAFDVLGSLAHTKMLESIGLMDAADLMLVQKELKAIYTEIENNNFEIEPDVEDVHSQVEMLLTRRIGEAGKKIHSGRSRNDQVLVDLKLFFRHQLQTVVTETDTLFRQLIQLSEQHKDVLLPGYTHLQVAMPSSFGLWFGAYAEGLVDDLEMVLAAWKITNKNPLGSAAGYGSSFPLNRTMTTNLLGFESLNHNVVYAQMGRGKTERVIAQALSSIAATLAKMAMDQCLYLSQNFAFVSYPENLTTGSSIMPHKKNPDVWEIMRGKCNRLQALPNDVALMTTNLPSGYHRELQLLKELLFPAFTDLIDCLQMATFMLQNISVNKNILDDPKYTYLFSVEEVNKSVLNGTPFRDAYKQIGLDIEAGNFNPEKTVNHTHEGSIGNLQNEEITKAMDKVVSSFDFKKVEDAISWLVK
ncbi:MULTISPECIES: argininosuccinate lyase [unclassified Mucilaginibacter]|uniref:argininosuccinate lyase n=1 Tax=unclassified Mucilaginibacter TaxID=2617802 RepID=UPI002AC93EDF|nr:MULTISPECIES: argininosuccinate lyase [unclassified Mucilaginibacter]MEB0263664.1 argininosuccinate lyase [Mucilaginibacter sp. 10I4]MEB0277021.1 argininosuccinate lyase [Mucilaginibacter sp. 10B2]MEB0302974.1 argininosuccinate lyase [Mucilaginibacter sp. 5C4]WPX25121.1 argininosuccinate lyase [Mucilaginibacter sp. 5C4]